MSEHQSSTVADLRVVASGSTDPGLGEVASRFAQATGRVARVTYDNEVADGETAGFDVLVASRDAIGRKFGDRVTGVGAAVAIGRMGIGVAVRVGEPVPDVSSVEALERAVNEADAVLVTTHTSGIHAESILRNMRLAEDLETKLLRYTNGPLLMDRLLHGPGHEFGFLSMNQISRSQGLVAVGPLPAEVQLSREFVAVPLRDSNDPELAQQFVTFCGEVGSRILAAYGFV